MERADVTPLRVMLLSLQNAVQKNEIKEIQKTAKIAAQYMGLTPVQLIEQVKSGKSVDVLLAEVDEKLRQGRMEQT